MYQIYKLTAPSGKMYIGLTKQTIKVRWSNHVRKAFTRVDYNHGLYNAIRKYGPAAFVISELATAASKQEAQRLERRFIALEDPSLLYNVSPGGEADGETGSRLFWGAMDADPVAKAAYLAKLSAIKKADDWSDYPAMSVQAALWRKENPKEAYRFARRGLRIANRGSPPRNTEDTRSLKERLQWKHKRGDMVRKNTTAFWENVPDETRAAIREKVRAASVAQWGRVTDKSTRSKLTEKARNSIDRAKQGAAASAGIKRWWTELKADPARYAAYIEQRKQTLRTTLESKNENL